MKILVDENIPRMTVEYLRLVGYDVRDVRGTSKQGLPDPDLWQAAISEGRLLIQAIETIGETEWPNRLVVVRDATMSTSVH